VERQRVGGLWLLAGKAFAELPKKGAEREALLGVKLDGKAATINRERDSAVGADSQPVHARIAAKRREHARRKKESLSGFWQEGGVIRAHF
jgi:hypothetical protein